MSRFTLHCPECGGLAPPTIVQPPPRIHQCIRCGARTPHAELKSTQHWAQGHGLVGDAGVPRLMQILNATTIIGTFIVDPVPGTGTIVVSDTNTPAGYHDSNDSTVALATLTSTALKSNGAAFIDVDFDPCGNFTIDFVRTYMRAKYSGNGNNISSVQMDYNRILRGGTGGQNFPAGVTAVFTDGYADSTQYSADNGVTNGPWTAGNVNNAGWFIELPFSIQNGPDSKSLFVSECHLEIWGH